MKEKMISDEVTLTVGGDGNLCVEINDGKKHVIYWAEEGEIEEFEFRIGVLDELRNLLNNELLNDEDKTNVVEYIIGVEYKTTLHGQKYADITVDTAPEGMPFDIFEADDGYRRTVSVFGSPWHQIDCEIDDKIAKARRYVHGIVEVRESTPKPRTITI